MEKAIDEIITLQRKFFADGATRATAFRLDALTELRKAVRERTDALSEALREDLNKSAGESYLTEIGLVMQELECHIRHLKRWSRSRRVSTPLTLWPSRSRIRPEPLGVALIVAPWNYPVQLLLCPLVGAISAGNCVLLKSSPLVPHVEAALRDLIAETFGPEYVAFVEGGGDVLDELLKRRFDSIFFTGGSKYGRVVMEAAAKNLTPVTLELGGKSPCIVGRSANIRLAARRIMWGKLLAAGQTCVAPDYLLVHRDLKEGLCREMKHAVGEFFGDYPLRSPAYPRIVSERATARLAGMIGASGRVLWGGEFDVRQRYVAPTLIDDPDDDSPAMTEEIFGPLLPVKTFRHIDEAIGYVNRRDKPLALYYFGDRREAERVLDRTSSGGACVNDTIVHLANGRLPFGGVGESGFGKYHGRSRVFDLSQQHASGRPVVEADRSAVEIRSVPAVETISKTARVNGLRSVESVSVARIRVPHPVRIRLGGTGACTVGHISGRSAETVGLFVGEHSTSPASLCGSSFTEGKRPRAGSESVARPALRVPERMNSGYDFDTSELIMPFICAVHLRCEYGTLRTAIFLQRYGRDEG